MIKIKIVLIVVVALMFTGCGIKQNISNNTISSGKTNVFFYRESGNKDNVAIVKIGERVVGSILPDSYAVTKVCTNTIQVGVAARGSTISFTNYLPPIDVNGTESIFFKVNEIKNEGFVLTRVTCDVGQKSMEAINKKSRVINRNVLDCKIPINNKKILE